MICEVDDLRMLGEALEKMCAALGQTRIPEEKLFDCKLVACELLSNALRYGGGRASLCAERREGEVVIRVRSTAGTRPPAQAECSDVGCERGRGLFLVDALTVSRTYSEEEGVCVVIRLA